MNGWTKLCIMQERTCIIIPCYNEAKRFKAGEFLDFLEREPDIDFCCVNDGSTDGTEDILRHFCSQAPGRLHCVSYSGNKGKAEAVRTGVQHILALKQYRKVGFADADLATPLSEIKRLIQVFGLKRNACLVMGSRVRRMGVHIERRFFRHYIGRSFAVIIALLFRLRAYDTQCGAKILTADLAETVFDRPFLSRWLFDVEILLRIRNMRSDYDKIIQEIPLDVWLEQGKSKIRFSHFFKMPVQLWKMYFRYRG